MWVRLSVAAVALILVRPTRADPVMITVDPTTKLATIPADFVGFGYETSAAAQPGFFSPDNRRMIRLYQNVCPHGLIRIGGNVSDHTSYEPDGPAVVQSEKGVTVINRKSLDELGRFLHAAGWRAMWGLNLATGSKDDAVTEAVAVDGALGDALQSFQVGNEVDLMRKYSKDYPGYHAAYADYKGAIRAMLPKAVFSGPDAAHDLSFVDRFAAAESGDVALLTHHYYRTDVSDKKNATMEYLLLHDDRWDGRLTDLRRIAGHTGYRINEVNSFSGGGKKDVSDTFGSALWALDYCFTCAAHGCRGVNMQTDINHRAFVSHYSPIVHDDAGVCSARPEYYGLLAFTAAARGDVVGIKLDTAGINLTAYATKDGDLIRVVVINKDYARDASLTIVGPTGSTRLARLSAPTIESKTGVSFAGASVAEDGTFSAGAGESIPAGTPVQVPHASAAVVTFTKP